MSCFVYLQQWQESQDDFHCHANNNCVNFNVTIFIKRCYSAFIILVKIKLMSQSHWIKCVTWLLPIIYISITRYIISMQIVNTDNKWQHCHHNNFFIIFFVQFVNIYTKSLSPQQNKIPIRFLTDCLWKHIRLLKYMESFA